MDAELEQSFTQPGHLGASTRRARGSQPELLHEDERGGREEHAQLIGPEATAARAPDLKSVVEGIKFVRKITAPLKKCNMIAEEESPGDAVQSDEALGEYVRDVTALATLQ